MIEPTRGYPAFLIVQRNVEWFYDDRLSAPAYGTRTTFGDSELIWQFYPGSGWQRFLTIRLIRRTSSALPSSCGKRRPRLRMTASRNS